MKLQKLYRPMMVVLAGGTMLQATGSCSEDLMGTLVSTLVPVAVSALLSVITGAL